MDSKAVSSKTTTVSTEDPDKEAPNNGTSNNETPIKKEENPQEAVPSKPTTVSEEAPSKEAPNNETPNKEEENPREAGPSKAEPSKPVRVAPSRALGRAIHQSELERLRIVLENICRQSEVANALVERELLISVKRKRPVADVLEQGVKRQRSRFAMCEKCCEEYDLTRNTDISCDYHPGKLRYREEYSWEDRGVNCFDCLMLDDDYKEGEPEGFAYDCCNKDADSEGCRFGRHREATDYEPETKRYKWQHCHQDPCYIDESEPSWLSLMEQPPPGGVTTGSGSD